MIKYHKTRGSGSMVEHQLPKLMTRVRFPSPAPHQKAALDSRLLAVWCGFVFSLLYIKHR